MPVYVIRSGDDGPVKIGFATSVGSRLVKLQSDNHSQLHVLRILKGGVEQESALHQRFAPFHLRGDWFTFCTAMLGDVGLEDIPLESLDSKRFAPKPLDRSTDLTVQKLLDHVGGVVRLAVALDVKHNTVCDWKRTGFIPSNRVLQISEVLSLPISDVIKLTSVRKSRAA